MKNLLIGVIVFLFCGTLAWSQSPNPVQVQLHLHNIAILEQALKTTAKPADKAKLSKIEDTIKSAALSNDRGNLRTAMETIRTNITQLSNAKQQEAISILLEINKIESL